MLFEMHSTDEQAARVDSLADRLKNQGIEVIHASSQTRLSKYHATVSSERFAPIFVVDQYDTFAKPIPIEQCTQVFKQYEDARVIERLYVSDEDFERGTTVINSAPREA